MRPRAIFWFSVGLNLALVAALFFAIRLWEASQNQKQQALELTNAVPGVVRTNFVVRRQNFTWQEIESTDYRTYIANLRAIGCPEPTIRDIIVADVNALFDRRRATEVVVPEQHWWKSELTQKATQAALAQYEALDAERRALLTELLGTNWDVVNSAELAAFNLRLDGPVLGRLPPKLKQTLRDIEMRATQRQQSYLEDAARAGKETDPAAWSRLHYQTRTELAQVLNAEQLEEYLLRYSPTAQRLRAELQGFEVSPSEFRQLFRERDGVEHQIYLVSGGNDPASVKRREELELQREAVLKQTLGSDRYQLFRYSRDPIFRQAQTSAQQIGAPPEVVLPLYQINQATELERQRISRDNTMTLEERASALASMMSQQQQSLRKLLGEEAYLRYRQTERP